MLPWNEMPSPGCVAHDKPIMVAGFFGAENVVVKPFNFTIDKLMLFKMFCKKMFLD
jgi:hypothetical protein